jgi:hypothetical protein
MMGTPNTKRKELTKPVFLILSLCNNDAGLKSIYLISFWFGSGNMRMPMGNGNRDSNAVVCTAADADINGCKTLFVDADATTPFN